MRMYEVGEEIRVKVKSSNRDSTGPFAVGMEYDAEVQSLDENNGLGIGFQIKEPVYVYCLEHQCAHLDGGDWTIL